MRGVRRPLGVALACLTALPALADTPPDAEAVRATLAPYLGQTLTKAMTLTPEGTGLKMGFGTKPVKVPLIGNLASFTLQPYDQLLTPNPDGTWLVTGDSPVAVLFAAPGTEFAVRMKSAAFEGTFDPKIMGFTASHMTAEGLEQGDKSSDPSLGNSLSTTARSVADQTARPGSAPGLIDASGSRVDTDSTQTNRKGFGSTAITIPNASSRYSITDLRQASILDLWQWMVAHPSPKDWAKDPDEMRRLVRAALPLYDKIQVSVGADRVKIVTMFGTAGLDRATYELQSDGLSAEAAISQEVTIAGLTLPSIVPDWAKPMAPSYVRIKISADDLPLAGLADEILKSYKPGPVDSFESGLPERLTAIFRSDSRTANVEAFHLKGQSYDIDASGGLLVYANGSPLYNAKVSAYGLSALSTELKKSGDPSAKSIAAFLDMALRIARITPDGRAEWDISGTSWKMVLVNHTLFP